MGEHGLTIPFSGPAAGADAPALKLVQAPWSKKTAGGFYEWAKEQGIKLDIWNAWFWQNYYLSQCDEDGRLCPKLRVYTTPGLQYQLQASYGELSLDVRIVEDVVEETVSVDVADSVRIDFATSIISAEFGGNVYDAVGNIIPTPSISINGNILSFPGKVFGSMIVRYNTRFFEHSLSIAPRDYDEALQESESFDVRELYASAVWAFYEGRVASAVIDMPDDFGTCDGGSVSGTVGPGDDDDEGEVGIVIEPFDYCTEADISVEDICVYIDDRLIEGNSTVVSRGEHTIRVVAPGYLDTDVDRLLENGTFTV